MHEKLEKAKEVIKKNWKPFTVGVVLTTVTVIVTKRVNTQSITFAKKIVIKDSVLLVQTYARKQGPPSYLVRCIENDLKWSSQYDAARALGVSPSEVSKHLNGARRSVKGKHLERIAMVVPNSG